jgi:hypothetical protein
LAGLAAKISLEDLPMGMQTMNRRTWMSAVSAATVGTLTAGAGIAERKPAAQEMHRPATFVLVDMSLQADGWIE